MKEIKSSLIFFIKHMAIGIIVIGILTFFIEDEEQGMFWFQIIMGFIGICIMFYYFLEKYKSLGSDQEYIRKKFIRYSIIFAIEIILIFGISFIFGISTRNTWLSLVGANVIFTTAGVLMCDIARYVKETNEPLAIKLHLVTFFLAMALVLVNLFVFVMFLGRVTGAV